MKEIRVILDKDGADLRREKAKSRLYLLCDGTADDEEINQAIEDSGKGNMWVISAEHYERIFGGKR